MQVIVKTCTYESQGVVMLVVFGGQMPFVRVYFVYGKASGARIPKGLSS